MDFLETIWPTLAWIGVQDESLDWHLQLEKYIASPFNFVLKFVLILVGLQKVLFHYVIYYIVKLYFIRNSSERDIIIDAHFTELSEI